MASLQMGVAQKLSPRQRTPQSVAMMAAVPARFRLNPAQPAKRQGSCSKPVVACRAEMSPLRSTDAKAGGGSLSVLTTIVTTTIVLLAAAYLCFSVLFMVWHFFKENWMTLMPGNTISESQVVLTVMCGTYLVVYACGQKIQEFFDVPEKMAYGFQDLRAHISDQVGHLKSRVGTLQSKVKDLDSGIGKLESEFGNLDSQLEKLESKVSDLGSEFEGLEGLESDISSLQTQMSELSNEVENLNRQSGQQA